MRVAVRRVYQVHSMEYLAELEYIHCIDIMI